MKIVLIYFSLVIFALAFGATETVAQRSATNSSIYVSILRSEDARRYDKALERILKSRDERVRVRATLAAGRIGDDAAVPALSALVERDDSMKVREMAAFALGEIESIKAADIILRVIG